MELRDTVEMMNSADYKKRFKAEYYQTKIRYEKLKAFNNKIEAAEIMQRMECCEPVLLTNRQSYLPENKPKLVEMPKHDCPEGQLKEQQRVMGEYLHILEVRAVIEGIEL